jgi:endonuclease YncB( thermonuclease family)
MRTLCCVAALLLVPLCVHAAPEPPPPPVLDTVGLSPVTVLEVLDGGRITVDIMGQALTVRLLGVAAPDPASRNALLAQNGAAARDALSELLAGQDVVLDPDPERPRNMRGPRWPAADADGVLGAHLWRASDGLLVNSELLRRGVAYYNSGSTRREQYLRWYSWCQRQARDSQLGVWGGEKLVAAGNSDEPARLLPPPGDGMPDINLPDGVAGPARNVPGGLDSPEFSGDLDPAAVLPSGIKLERASARVTSQGRESWDFSWRTGLKSTSRRRVSVDVTVRFLDADGYILAETVETGVSVPARSAVEARGTRNIPADAARRVSSVSVLVERSS